MVVYLIGASIAIVTNFATSVFPKSWQPHLWLSWPVLGVLILAGILLLITDRDEANNYLRIDSEHERAAFNRRSMLSAVRNIWIDGVLERSVLRQIMIRLGLESRPDMLRDPWDLVIESRGVTGKLSPESSLRNILYQEHGLLILGEPGAGKTTLLLDLLRDLIAEADNDESVPIPVVFKLETWKAGEEISDWLVGELSDRRYGIARDVAMQWVTDSRIMPLLDGLDEVSLDQRLTCASSIDKFHAENTLLPIVVTSRIEDYESLGLKLALGSAVVVEPLSPAQVEEYLQQLGDSVRGLRSVLHRDPVLWELMRTPFFLGIAVAAYEGKKSPDPIANSSADDWRTKLIAAFVERALLRKPSQRSYDPNRSTRWLSLIARSLGMSFETVFYIESVDASWLSPAWRRFVIGITCVLAGVIDGGALYLTLRLFFTGYVPIIAGILSGLMFSVVAYTFRAEDGNPIIHFERKKRSRILAGSLGCWAASVVPLSLLFGIAGGICGFISGAIIGAINDASIVSQMGHYGAVWSVCGALLPIGLAAASGGFESTRENFSQRPTGKDLRDTVWLSFVLTFCFGVSACFIFGEWFGPDGIFAGVAIAISAGYLNSGSGMLGYWLTNARLAQTGASPFGKIKFLDYSVSRMLMYRVGGGYMFSHRLMLEYFASLDLADSNGGNRHHSLRSVDLRPEAVLMRVADDANDRIGDQVRALTYAGTYLPADQFVPVAWKIVVVLEGRLRDRLKRYGLSYGVHPIPVPGDEMTDIEAIYGLIINAGVSQYLAAAAFFRGELLSAMMATALRYGRTEKSPWEYHRLAIASYRIAVDSSDAKYGEAALSRLHKLEAMKIPENWPTPTPTPQRSSVAFDEWPPPPPVYPHSESEPPPPPSHLAVSACLRQLRSQPSIVEVPDSRLTRAVKADVPHACPSQQRSASPRSSQRGCPFH